MFENKIFHINQAEIVKIVQEIKKKPLTYLVEINGVDVQSWNDYILKIEEKMKFPTTCIDSIDRYLDWIRDLSWLDSDGYTLIIYSYSQFLSKDARIKAIVMDSLKETVLPFWQEEVERCVVGGKSKPFNVYLVD
ncbi:barstar family protein [Anaeropeptidivorans aminofermentans]|jgi:hypothetical protein|uniref:barstar family protein n=1 Tax=Anaeropeptidivorans aminofermentans TaxID=2934315 RepID=UPI00202556EA|nr:hypothetical protein [Anaeropeptidivorans aminofermentans]